MKIKVLFISLIAGMLMVGCGNSSSNTDSNSTDASSVTDTVSKTYNVENIVEPLKIQLDSSFSTTQTKFDEIDANIFALNGTDYGDLEFYIFDSADNAKKAFETIKSTYLLPDNLTNESNYVIGQSAMVNDLVVKDFYYISNNLIIKTNDYCSDPGSDGSESEYSIKKNKERHDKIMSIW